MLPRSSLALPTLPSTLFSYSLLLLSYLSPTQCVTVYGPTGAVRSSISSTSTASSSAPAYTDGAAAFNGVVLNPPPVPVGFDTQRAFSLTLMDNVGDLVNSGAAPSIGQGGWFYGFSVEMSVVDMVVGINSTFLNPPFLNLMSLLTARSGRVNIRVGGNTQDSASVVPIGSLPPEARGRSVWKEKTNSSAPTETPNLFITPELIYTLANVSALVNTKWYLGIPMNDTQNLRLQIAEVGEQILGENLLGMQVGNEPDLYAGHLHRGPDYSPSDYATEFGIVAQAVAQDSNIPTKNNLIGPSVASGPWKPEDVWATGFIQNYQDVLGALAVEHYPDNNCANAFPNGGFGAPKNPQDVFPNYLNHTSGVGIVSAYINSTLLAQQAGKPFVMFETNTASCGGFPGVSDAFGATLWALDYGMQMAYGNFSGALLHVGGQSDTYNPFTPPPTNQSLYHQWTVGAVFYSALALAETFGSSGQAQIVDLQSNGANIYTPGYAIYEGGSLARLALFNYVSDPSGASDLSVTVSTASGTMPAQVYVKYLVAPSVAEKQNITWAGQTFGGQFASDGRLQGNEQVVTVPCAQGRLSTCTISVPAPGMALVFLSPPSPSSDPTATISAQTFPTTTLTRTVNTAILTLSPSVLATAQGQNGFDRQHKGSTSRGSSSATPVVKVPKSALWTLGALVVGLFWTL